MGERISCLFGHRGSEKRAFIEITSYCNMKCAHCMNDSGENRFEGMDKDKIFRLLDELVEKDFKRLYISGGEPLLYKHIDDVLEYAHELGIKITLATNGWFVSDHINVIKKCVDIVSISFDGIGEIHDKMRGINGAYNRMVDALRLLNKNGVTTKVSCMIWNDNIDQHEEMVVVAKKLGVKKVNFAILVPVGRAKENREMLIDESQYPKIYSNIEKLTEKYKDEIAVEIKRQHGVSDKCLSCPGGDLILHIDARGKVSPCSWVSKIDQKEFSIMWEPGLLDKGIRQFGEFKQVLKEREKKYDYTGCLAMAYIHNGNYLAKDPINNMVNQKWRA